MHGATGTGEKDIYISICLLVMLLQLSVQPPPVHYCGVSLAVAEGVMVWPPWEKGGNEGCEEGSLLQGQKAAYAKG